MAIFEVVTMIRVAVICTILLANLAANAQLATFPSQGAPPSDCPAYRAGDFITFTATIVAAPGIPHVVLASATLAMKPGTSNAIVIPPTIGKLNSEGSNTYEFKMALPPIFLQDLATGPYRLIDASFGTGPISQATDLSQMRVVPLRVVGPMPQFCRFVPPRPNAPGGTATELMLK